MTASSPIWTPDALAYLCSAWPAGKLTAEQIGVELAALVGMPVSKGAVLGKCWRLGLVRPARPVKPKPAKAAGKPGACRKSRQSKIVGNCRKLSEIHFRQAPVLAESAIPLPGAWHLLDLAPAQCRFACSPHSAPSHLFCGEAVEAGCPYCERHARIAYREQPNAKQEEAA